jgi:peptidyl-tRNA hydrolase
MPRRMGRDEESIKWSLVFFFFFFFFFFIFYFFFFLSVVRTDLKMGSGKIAAQCGHATLGAYKQAMKKSAEDVKSWSRTGQAKIALKCPSLDELHVLAENAERAGVVSYIVVDAGRTQIEEGTETVLAIGPVTSSLFVFHVCCF